MDHLHEPEDAMSAVWRGLGSDVADAEADVVILGVPFDGGAAGAGRAALGPDHIRSLSKRMKTFTRRGRDVSHVKVLDRGNVATSPFDLPATIEQLGHAYRSLFRSTAAPILTLGGDHAITYPIVTEATAGRSLGLVWFDAHPDVLDTYMGSRLTHGSPLRRILDHDAIRSENVLLVGTRAYDQGETDYIVQTGIRELQAVEFEDDRASALAKYRESLAEVERRVDQLYVTVDIDVLDDSHVPGTGTPVPGGLSLGLLLSLIESISARAVGYDIVEFSPSQDVAGITGRAVMAILTEMLSHVAGRG